ncbi:peroxiredoxin [Pontibacterium granulatum]|uniref:peroxiredoxin n=1 Tax=Pontibacterium granulatum TaxID=2036029 RepID=UPI00249BD91E|nr:peroxiredoxin [Pontibacterium granulatum]MDI3324764.1 peroxiredoxin [Pontibacterium granulatum]
MIQVGDSIPEVTVQTMGEKGPENVSSTALFADQKIVLFAVPGAFTPTCSAAHLPGYVVKADEILAKGVDRIICMAVNDAFVMDAWGKASNADQILMVADGNGEFATALGLEADFHNFHMGLRSKRFAMVVENGVVKTLAVDEKGLEKTAAEAILATL